MGTYRNGQSDLERIRQALEWAAPEANGQFLDAFAHAVLRKLTREGLTVGSLAADAAHVDHGALAAILK